MSHTFIHRLNTGHIALTPDSILDILFFLSQPIKRRIPDTFFLLSPLLYAGGGKINLSCANQSPNTRYVTVSAFCLSFCIFCISPYQELYIARVCHLNVSKYTVEPKMPNESAGREALHTVETGARGDVNNYCSAPRRGAAAGDPGSLAPGARQLCGSVGIMGP